MKKKLFTMLLAVAASVGTMFAESGTCGENLTWTLDTGTGVLTISGTGAMKDYNYYNSNNSPWYNNHLSITSVTIGTGVTSIGDYAFYGCSSLTSVTIPNSVTSIGYEAFAYCRSLTSVTIPNSVTSIGYGAFGIVPNIIYNGSATGSPWGARSINGFVDGYLVYKDNTKTTLLACSSAAQGEISIPNSVTSIGEEAFFGCISLTSVTIPNSVTSIGNYAFSGCSSLTSVTIPNSVTSIGNYAFSNIPNIVYNGTATGSPWGAKSINGFVDGYLVYKDNTKTTLLACSSAAQGKITIPNSVKIIGDYAFRGCSSLTSVTIPNSVTSIGEWAFYECSSLTSVTIGTGVTSIGDYAFYGCSSLTSVTIPNSVTSIGERAFFYCTGLTSVTIPNSVTSIGEGAFDNVPNIVYNGTATGSPWGAKSINGFVDGYLVYKDNTKTTLLACSSAAQGEISIPNSVTSIGERAFYYCSSLTSVTIPNSVTSIGKLAFYECSSLTSVTIPNSVTSIGNYAFAYCSSLTSVTIPNSVTSIGNYAFSGCSSLTSVTIGTGVTSIGDYAFYGCSSLTSLSVEAGNTVYDSRNNCNAIIETATNTLIFGSKNTTIPNSVTSIGERAFYYCSSLTSVTIPNSVTSIGSSAFEDCRSLTSVTIPNSVTSIGNYAFSRCSSLTSVTIGNSVTSIGEGAFRYCSNLKNVIIGSAVKVLEESAFYGCSAIESITCYSQRPPTVNQDALYGLDYSTIVYVPADYFETYNMHDAWGLYDVSPLGAKSTETTDVNVTPAENTADVAWPAVADAATYELVIKDKNGNIICTLTFNAKGQLTQIAFNAPSRNNTPQHTQAAGFSFTVTGLEESTEYIYTLTAKDSKGNVIDTQTGTFKTIGGTAVEETERDSATGVRKVMRDGVIYLLMPDGRMYDLQGAEVR